MFAHFSGETFLFNAASAERFDAAFQACPEILHVVEVRCVGRELVEMLSSVVEPCPRAIRIASGGMVTEVKTVVIWPQATSAELHELMHSVTVQTSFIVITQDPRSVHSSTGKQDQMPIFGLIHSVMDKSKCSYYFSFSTEIDTNELYL